jgi:hypothetical protein
MDEHLAGGVGRRLGVRHRYSRHGQRQPCQTAAGKRRRAFLGRWRGRGARKGCGITGGGCSKGWEEGRWEIFWGCFCRARGPGALFPPCHELPALPIWSCRAGAGAGAPTVYFGSRARRHVLGPPVVHQFGFRAQNLRRPRF